MKKNYRLLVLLLWVPLMAQKFDKMALTPPMGWNSWNRFGCNVNEQLIRETADAMVSSGMKAAGYQYVVIDDCWQGERDAQGFIQPDPTRFPSGMKALADYIHSKGLKFGVYSDAGWKTCGGHPGSRGYEYQDALTYANWGVDYLKYDWCNTEGLNAKGAYMTMRDALFAAGRPVVFSICEWGDNRPWEWGKDIGHLWRTTGDIAAIFNGQEGHGTWNSWGVLQILDMRENIRQYAGPDHWNDPDMLEVGNGMTLAEDRAHFSLWCIQAAPLIAGNDLRDMSPEVRDILTNKELIAIDQDPLGIQGFKYLAKDNWEVWAKPLDKGELALCFLNRTLAPIRIDLDWKKYPVKDDEFHYYYYFNEKEYQIRDLWSKKEIGTTAKPLSTQVGAHDVVVLRLSPVR
ncbi:MAG TPA: glycoside hydrolase family 27 protein [Candidatus Marinimicrobia bacterium]|nr:glycoside hydrolase family 27 protein [Candidatus Neomarinimicrobiota bacterium]HRS51336.1 glycoside hydrolase family 27 protein [Candidatus Neomarinimicrobiota bacterium]HRU91426.1 glycoside hydrolase family 27 protein [Candidatus Neomarinimicrobiota bacterium]